MASQGTKQRPWVDIRTLRITHRPLHDRIGRILLPNDELVNSDDKTPAGQRNKFIVRGSELEYSREGNVPQYVMHNTQ
jgi:hypothetical protein